MATAAPLVPVELGQLVRRRTDPVDTFMVGRVGSLVFGDRDLALVRWQNAPSTFEPGDTLIEVRLYTASAGQRQTAGGSQDQGQVTRRTR